MDVILLERVAKLGQMGDVVSVKEGYARNYLLPQKKALRANDQNVAAFEAQKVQLEARNLELKKEADAMAQSLDGQAVRRDPLGLRFRVALRLGQHPRRRRCRDRGGLLARPQAGRLSRPIKELGLHIVHVRLHPEVEVDIELNVARSPEEAELQASGKSIQDLAAEEEAAADFEIAELFDDIGSAAADDEEGMAPAGAGSDDGAEDDA